MGFDTNADIEKFYANRFALRDVVKIGGKSYLVSTVELPPSPYGAPYETMIFDANEDGGAANYIERFCDRYDTQEEAQQGHAHALKFSEDDLHPNYGEE